MQAIWVDNVTTSTNQKMYLVAHFRPIKQDPKIVSCMFVPLCLTSLH